MVVAQLVELQIVDLAVTGSIPVDHPRITSIVKRILMTEKPKETYKLKRAASTATRWIGSVQSVVVHTAVFTVSFGAVWAGALTFDRMLLVLTTVVSLEAIYLAIFIQMSLNQATKSIGEVEQGIDEIQEDIDEIQEDVDELQEDVEEISEEDKADEERKRTQKTALVEIQQGLRQLMLDIERLKNASAPKPTDAPETGHIAARRRKKASGGAQK